MGVCSWVEKGDLLAESSHPDTGVSENEGYLILGSFQEGSYCLGSLLGSPIFGNSHNIGASIFRIGFQLSRRFL